MNDDYFADMRRVKTEHGDYVEPALNQDWPMLKKLEWQLAVLRVDTGIVMTVHRGNHWINGVKLLDQFSYSAPNHGWTPRGFHESWSLINGVKDGAMMAKEQAESTYPLWSRLPSTPSPARWTQPDFAPGISSVIRDRIKADGWQTAFLDRINDMKAELRSITDSRGYRAQDITYVAGGAVTGYE